MNDVLGTTGLLRTWEIAPSGVSRTSRHKVEKVYGVAMVAIETSGFGFCTEGKPDRGLELICFL